MPSYTYDIPFGWVQNSCKRYALLVIRYNTNHITAANNRHLSKAGIPQCKSIAYSRWREDESNKEKEVIAILYIVIPPVLKDDVIRDSQNNA